MVEKLAEYGDIDAVKYADGQHHLYRVDRETGKKIGHVGSDDFLREMGHDPSEPNPPARSSGSTSTGPGRIEYERGVHKIEIHNEFSPQNTNRMDHINVGGAGSEVGERPGGTPNRDPADDPNRRPPDERLQQLQEQVEQLNQRISELEQRNEELQTENEQLRARIAELENPPPPPGPTPEEITNAETALEEARTELARYDIRRSGRSFERFSRRRREDRSSYETALQNYRQALENLAQLRIQQEQAAGHSEGQIRETLTRMKYDEDAAYANRVVSLNDELIDGLHGWRRVVARGLRRWANVSTRNKIALGLVIGVGVGAASLLTGGGLAVLAAGSAARFSLGLVNHQASLRNVSQHSLERQLSDIEEDRQEALNNLGGANIDAHSADLIGQTVDERQANTRGNIRRNRRGAALMLAGAALTGAGIAHAVGVDVIPDKGWLSGRGWLPNASWLHPHLPSWLGGPHHSSPPGPWQTGQGTPNLPANFNMDTIHAHNTTEFVNNTFGPHGLLDRQGVKVDGLTSVKAQHLAEYLQNHHWRVVEGMQANGHGGVEQHVVNASTWQDGIHNPSHAEAWTSKQELQHAMQIAKDKFGINFRMES